MSDTGIARATGYGSIAVCRGGEVEVGERGTAVTHEDRVAWRICKGAVLVQHTGRGVFVLEADKLDYEDGARLLVYHGRITRTTSPVAAPGELALAGSR